MAVAPQSRRAGRPSPEVAAGLRELILDAARALFLDQGFAATGVQQIAARAGVTKRTLYVKVGDKEALFSAVVTDMLQGWRHSVDGVAQAGKLQSRLEQVGRQLLAILLAPDLVRLHRVLTAEIHRFPRLIHLMMEQSEDGPIPRLAHLLMEERGSSGMPSRDDLVAARLLHEMILSAPLRNAVFGREPSIRIARDEWVQQAVTLFLLGWDRTSKGGKA